MNDLLRNAIQSVAPLDDADMDLMPKQLLHRKIKKGEYYIREGEVEKQIGFIAEGSFRWFFLNDKAEEINFHFFFKGQFIVEFHSFLTRIPSSLYIQAMEDSELIVLLDRQELLDLYSQSHRWEHFGRTIAERVYIETAERVRDFLFLSAEERYLKLIRKHPDIFQKVSLSNISSYLGVQPPSLSRIRRRVAGK